MYNQENHRYLRTRDRQRSRGAHQGVAGAGQHGAEIEAQPAKRSAQGRYARPAYGALDDAPGDENRETATDQTLFQSQGAVDLPGLKQVINHDQSDTEVHTQKNARMSRTGNQDQFYDK